MAEALVRTLGVEVPAHAKETAHSFRVESSDDEVTSVHALADLVDVVRVAEGNWTFLSDDDWDAEDESWIMEHAKLVLHHDKSRARQDEFRVHEDMLRM